MPTSRSHPIASVSVTATAMPLLATGIVRALLTDEDISLELFSGIRRSARPAASCLLAPAIGDRVLVHDDGADCFILAVLERADAARPALLSVRGAAEVALGAREILSLSAPLVSLKGERLRLVGRFLTLAGDALTTLVKRIIEKASMKTADIGRLNVIADSRTATVRETDLQQAGVLVQKVETVAAQSSTVTLVSATEDVRFDAKRVSVG